MTRADEIRSMTDEEMARWLYPLVAGTEAIDFCPGCEACGELLDEGFIPRRGLYRLPDGIFAPSGAGKINERRIFMKRTTPPDRLTRDVMAAQAAGLSYGMYKALHPYTGEWEPVEVELEDDRREITCQFCGNIFLAYGQECRRKYCTDECRQQAQYAAYRAKHPIPMVPCVICGKEMPRRSGRKYCGNACKVEGYRRKQAEWNGRRPRKRKEKQNV